LKKKQKKAPENRTQKYLRHSKSPFGGGAGSTVCKKNDQKLIGHPILTFHNFVDI
jgi:hypothetical protein